MPVRTKGTTLMEIPMIEMSQVLALARGKRTIGIDGLPVSGKSTLADQLEAQLGATCLYLDDFVLPEDLWARPLRPAFPFPYIHYAQFLAAASALAATRTCTYRPYDWASGQLAGPRELQAGSGPVIIEGVSALCETLAPLYDLKIWVQSDPATTLAAAYGRGPGNWRKQWQDYFLPSVELYMATDPLERADVSVMGRGA
jgi:uridine kinase